MDRGNGVRGLVAFLLVGIAATAPTAAPAVSQPREAPLIQSFNVADLGRTRQVIVHISLPDRVLKTSPVLVVMHGNTRNAVRYHGTWRPHARAHGAVLVTPEFSRQDWPRTRHYHQGNLLTADKSTKPRAVWSFTAMEHAVAIAARIAGIEGERFYLYGHSAGAQFVHRYVMATGGARLIRAVAANAGWYSWPSRAKHYPYGVAPLDTHRWDWKGAFGTRLTILLGENDNDPESRSLRRSASVMFQGRHRLERGTRFFAAARALSAETGADFNWRLETVPGVAHSNAGMAEAAARLLFRK